jgi:hypothetical protein
VAAVATAALMAVSAGWAAIITTPGADPSRAYYGTDARIQELLAGALLALVATRGNGLAARAPGTARIADAAGVAALAWILWLSASIDSAASWLFDGGMLAVALAVCLVVVAVRQPTSVLRRALSWRPLVWLGLLSYGLYLWHYPVYVMLSPERAGLRGGALLAARLAATACLALASYRLVERPIRVGAWSTRGWVGAATASLALTALALAAVVPGRPSTPSLVSASQQDRISEVAGQPAAPAVDGATPSATLDKLTDYVPHDPPSISTGDRSTRVLATGDSVALTLSMWFQQRHDHPVTLWDTSFFGCPLFPSTRRPATNALSDADQCEPWRADRDRWIRQFDPDVVTLLAGVWEMYDKEVDGQVLAFGSPEFDKWFSKHLDGLVDQLGAGGAAVVILGPPCNQRSADITGAEPPENQSERLDHLTKLYRAAAARSGERVSFIDLNGFVCPGGSFLKDKNGVELREDDGVHFTPDGAELVRSWLYPQLVKLGRSSPRFARAGA